VSTINDVVPWYVWIPFVVLGALLVLLLVVAVLGRIQNGRYLRPVVVALAKVPFMKSWFQRMSVAQLERSNPELASAVKKMQAFGEPTSPDQVQRALRVLTPSERKAYMDAAGLESPAVETTNRQQRRRLEHGGAGMPGKPATSSRPGSAGRKSGAGKKKKR
jgi:hypothetical protein